MANGSLNFNFQIDQSIIQNFTDSKMRDAREKAVEAAGMVWADETKEIVREDDHIDTGLFVNSIGYITRIGTVQATEADVVNEIASNRDTTTLKIGSAVAYAAPLEKKYNIMARGLDRAQTRMNQVAEHQLKSRLGL
ncbi:hypothetical protein [Planomicrobium sp. CPCC 101079]|uniref:hypothetical protein n=1 Tax=Planomicrobium sp. CPCC 101079 TaxID=2599618 RepID=UPI0011B78B09|nr:hypothetical protein [Planomicrobium sp. CPCC 101079]TWT04606.1 hypothetical protein FQV28_08360 [Planomicrobium sp. CPCC 101079]